MSRFEAYTSTKEKVLEKVESGFKTSRFTRPLPAQISKDKQFCQDIHEIFVKKTVESIKENFDHVEKSSKLEQNLQQLDAITSDNSCKSENSVAWRPDSSASNNQSAHDLTIISAAKLKLEQEILQDLQNEVDDLEKQVTSLSYEIAENSANIKQSLVLQE